MIGEIWNDGDNDYLILGVRTGVVWFVKFTPGGEKEFGHQFAADFYRVKQWKDSITDRELHVLLEDER